MDDDEVIDYLIMEAVAAKAAVEDEKLRKKQKVDDWKKDKSELEQFR